MMDFMDMVNIYSVKKHMHHQTNFGIVPTFGII